MRWTLKSTAEYRGFKPTAVSGHTTTHAFPVWNLVFSHTDMESTPQQGDCLSSCSLHPEASCPPRSLPFKPRSSLRPSPSQAVVFPSSSQDKCPSLLCACILNRRWLQYLSQEILCVHSLPPNTKCMGFPKGGCAHMLSGSVVSDSLRPLKAARLTQSLHAPGAQHTASTVFPTKDDQRQRGWFIFYFKNCFLGTSLVVQWLRTLRSQCRAPRFHPWLGNQMPHATRKRTHTLQLRPGTAK